MSKKHEIKKEEDKKVAAAEEIAEASADVCAGVEEAEVEVMPAEEVVASEAATPDTQLELEKYRDLALRTAADFDNFRKRAAREREDAIRYANNSLIEKLLPVLDSFEMGLDAARTSDNPAAVVDGLDMVKKQFADFLRDQGVEVIDAMGEKFDHNLHDALGSEASDKVPEGGVVRQLRKGYKLKGRLVRPASVFVSKGSAQ